VSINNVPIELNIFNMFHIFYFKKYELYLRIESLRMNESLVFMEQTN